MTASPTSNRLAGRRALVTGATHGIGLAIAETLAANGADVVITGRTLVEGDAAVAAIGAAGGSAHFIAADMADGWDAIQRLAAEATDAGGGAIDLLVNNAAQLIPAQSLLDVDPALLQQALAVNIAAPILVTKAIVPGMLETGGTIVNIGSINGSVGMSVAALYGATKAALHSLTASWAAELAPRGIRVNAVAPGPTATPANADSHEHLRELAAAMPDGRPGTGEEIAAAVLFLSGDEAAHIHGIVLPVDGGFLATR